MSNARLSLSALGNIVGRFMGLMLRCGNHECTHRWLDADYKGPDLVARVQPGVGLGACAHPGFHPGYLYIVSAKSSRPISIRLISLVPAPISYSFASRHSLPKGYSLMYPLPPKT